VIAELLGVPAELAPQLRRWSQAIVRMYEVAPTVDVEDAAVAAAEEFASVIRGIARERAHAPREDLISDLVSTGSTTRGDGSTTRGSGLSEDEVVASAVLLLNAGHEASVNVFGNGLVALLERGVSVGDSQVVTCVEEMLRFDSALQLFERTATVDVPVGDVVVQRGQKIAALLGAANRDPAVFEDPNSFHPDRAPNPHLAFGAGVHFCLGAPLARMELAESLGYLLRELPMLRLVADPVSRGTFVLRGYTSVQVGG
jgi:unspecific monooxygenase